MMTGKTIVLGLLVAAVTAIVVIFAVRKMRAPGSPPPPSKPQSTKSKISREMLQQMFDGMSAKSKWDVSKPMLWGYFFTNDTPEPLKKASEMLVSQGYRFVDTHQDENGQWWLHVEKEEVHTVDSLYRRNEELYDFADRLGLSSYDGMDVGPISTTKG